MSEDQAWRKSSRSNAQSACVELRVGATRIDIRDTKNRSGGTITIGAAPFRAFLSGCKTR